MNPSSNDTDTMMGKMKAGYEKLMEEMGFQP